MTRTTTRFLSIAALVVALGSAPPVLADPSTDPELPDGYTGVPDEIQTRLPERTSRDQKGDKQTGTLINSTSIMSVESTTSTRIFRFVMDAARQEIWILLARH